MRLAVVGYPLLVERQWQLYSALGNRHEVHLLTPHSWPTAPTEDEPNGSEPFAHHRHRCVFDGSMNRYLMPGLLRTLRSIDPDVTLTHGEPWQPNTFYTEFACETIGAPHIVFSWENLDRVPRRTVQRLLERATLNGIDGIIAGSDAAADRLRARGYDGPTAVAPETGVNTEAFGPRKHNAELRDRFGIDDGPVVLYTGRLVPEKGLTTLLDSVTDVADAVPDVQYLIIGEGEMAADLRERIRQSNLGDRVTLVTERQPYELMPAIYSLAAVFTYPSYTVEGWAEQFGYSVVEAMSCGVPVVTTECGSLPWVVGDTGVVCPEQDTDTLATALVDLLSDDDRRERLGTAARERAREEFSIPRVAEKHEAMFKETRQHIGINKG